MSANHAEVVAASRARRSDVGADLDAALEKVDRRRRARCAKSLRAFAKTYCCGEGGFLETPPPSSMEGILDEMQTAIGDSSMPYHIRIARGHGKTSYMKCAVAWVLSYGVRRFVVSASADASKAAAIIGDILAFMTTAPEWCADFPEISVPLRRLGGAFQRAKSQTCHGENTDIRLSSKEIRLPNVKDADGKPFPASGAILHAVGLTGNVRGLVHGAQRPDMVLFDDLQNAAMAQSAERVAEAARLVRRDFMGLAGHRRKIAAIMTSTPIAPGDLSELFADDGMWRTSTYRMVESWPDGFDERNPDQGVWGEYAKLLRAGIATKAANPFAMANRFYRAHRTELERGAKTLNPGLYDRKTEVSAFQHALNTLIRDGAEAFASEYQMRPQRSQTVYELTYREVLNAANGLPPLRIPQGCKRVFAAIDVMKTAGLRYVVMAIGPERLAAVVNYGRYPADNTPLFDSADQMPVKQAKVATALDGLVSLLEMTRFPAAGAGNSFQIGAIGIDAGWMHRPVMAFCRAHARCFAMRGVSWMNFAPRTRSGQFAQGILDATDWEFEKQSFTGGTFLGFHADYWREMAQRAWLNVPLTPSSLSVFGRAEEHLQFAQECVADQLILKDKTRSGGEMWKWNTAGANHLGDCVTMCLALAHWRRAYSVGGDIGQEGVIAPSAPAAIVRKPARPAVRCV